MLAGPSAGRGLDGWKKARFVLGLRTLLQSPSSAEASSLCTWRQPAAAPSQKLLKIRLFAKSWNDGRVANFRTLIGKGEKKARAAVLRSWRCRRALDDVDGVGCAAATWPGLT